MNCWKNRLSLFFFVIDGHDFDGMTLSHQSIQSFSGRKGLVHPPNGCRKPQAREFLNYQK